MSLSNKKLIIILSVSATALIGITTLLIFIAPNPAASPAANNQTGDPNSPEANPMISRPTSPANDESALAIKSLTETHTTPSISTNNATNSITELKDQTMQSKINQDIQNACTEIQNEKQKLESEHKDSYPYADCWANVSIGDTLSMFARLDASYQGQINVLDGFNEDEAPAIHVPYRVITKNYRLDTGAEIKFGDLFVAGTDLTPIITKAAYEAIHCRTEYCGGGGLSWHAKIDDIDAEFLTIIQSFRSTENPPFYFNFQDISLWIAGYQLDIRMEDWYDKIAIFKRFKSTENLYETSQTAPMFVFQTAEANYKNEFISDNLFARINLYEPDSVPDAIIAKRDSLLNSVIDQAIAATKNQNAFYILDFKISSNESYLNDGTYHTSISVICGWDGTEYDYCAKLSKLPLNPPSKTSALETIAAASRYRANLGDALSIPNTTDNRNFWSNFKGYTIDKDNPKFSDITYHYDKSGNQIQE